MSDVTPPSPAQPATPPQPPTGSVPPETLTPPASGAPAPRKKKSLVKRWWFWTLVAVAVIVVITIAAGGGDPAPDTSVGAPAAAGSASASAPATPTATKTAQAPQATPVGTAAQAGDLQLTVTQVETGVPQLGDELDGTLLGEKAQGQFVLVHLTVKNTGNDPVYFSSSDLPMYDAQGRTFSADDSASIYIKDNTTLFEEINPGNTLQGVVVYDIPGDAKPATLKYKSSLFGKSAVLALG